MNNAHVAWQVLRFILGAALLMAAAIYSFARLCEWLFKILGCELLCDYCAGQGELPDLESAAADSKVCPICKGEGSFKVAPEAR